MDDSDDEQDLVLISNYYLPSRWVEVVLLKGPEVSDIDDRSQRTFIPVLRHGAERGIRGGRTAVDRFELQIYQYQ